MFNNLTQNTNGAELRPLEICLYGQAGMGKTTFAATTNNPLILSFEGGVDRAKLPASFSELNITWDADTIVLQLLHQFSQPNVQQSLQQFDAIVIDTIGAMFTSIGDHLILQNPRMGNPGGGLSMQGWGAVAKKVKSFIGLIKAIGLNVIYLAQEDQRVIEDVLKFKPDVPGNVVYKHIVENCDMIGRIYSESKIRKINFESNDVQLGKNFINIPPSVVPDYEKLQFEQPNMRYIIESAQKQKAAHRAAVLAKIAQNNELADQLRALDDATEIAKLYAKTNPSPNQRPIFARKWNEMLGKRIESINSLELANQMLELIPSAQEAGLPDTSVTPLKKQLLAKSKSLGYTYDKKTESFTDKK